MNAGSNPFAHLPNYRERGDGFVASCPGPLHKRGDRNPSMSVRRVVTRNGSMWVPHCFVGCSLEEILTALGMKKKDLYDDAGLYRPDSGKGSRHRHRRVEGIRQREDRREWRETEMMKAAVELRERDQIIRLINDGVNEGKLSVDEGMDLLADFYDGYSELEYRFESLRVGTAAEIEELWKVRHDA